MSSPQSTSLFPPAPLNTRMTTSLDMALSSETEYKLKNLLVALGDGERYAESLRQRLCLIRDFAPRSAFDRIDRDGSGSINSSELLAYLRDQRNFSATESETYQLVKYFDNDNGGSLSFQE